jgi:predicted dehydrogenase
LNPYNAIILGCGRIAGGYDKPGSSVVLTHAHAIIRSSKINLAGLYDINAISAREMADKWQTKAYHSIEEIFKYTNPDIVILAVPDEFHEEMLDAIKAYTPKCIICEKPLGKNLVKLKSLLENYKNRNIGVAVNFSRNYDLRIVQLKKEIQVELFGELLNGVFFYSKGLRHNGAHAISLLRFLFGEVEGFNILDARVDYKREDPSIDLQLQFRNGKKCYLLAGDERQYSIFEWQFVFSGAKFVFKNDGFRLCRQEVIDDPLFPGYKTLGEEICEETGLKNSMSVLYENVLKNIEEGEALFCPAEDAFATQSIIEKIFDNLDIDRFVKK